MDELSNRKLKDLALEIKSIRIIGKEAGTYSPKKVYYEQKTRGCKNGFSSTFTASSCLRVQNLV